MVFSIQAPVLPAMEFMTILSPANWRVQKPRCAGGGFNPRAKEIHLVRVLTEPGEFPLRIFYRRSSPPGVSACPIKAAFGSHRNLAFLIRGNCSCSANIVPRKKSRERWHLPPLTAHFANSDDVFPQFATGYSSREAPIRTILRGSAVLTALASILQMET
jgi:hypothetical protein